MRYWLARLLHRLAYRIYEDPPDNEASEIPIQYVIELPHGPREHSEPLDAHALWREQVYDGAFYNEDEDVYRPGTYL